MKQGTDFKYPSNFNELIYSFKLNYRKLIASFKVTKILFSVTYINFEENLKTIVIIIKACPRLHNIILVIFYHKSILLSSV